MKSQRLFVQLAALLSVAFVMPTAAQVSTVLAITSPAVSTTVNPGQSLPITVSIASGTYPNGIAIFAQDPLGTAYASSVTGSTVILTLSIPANANPGSYAITAVGTDATGTLVSSTPINVIVERPDVPTALSVAPSMIKLRFIGDTLPITVLGTFANGSQLDITQSSHLTATVADPTVATVQNGMVTAVGIGQNTLGQTTITLQYGQLSATVAVTVPLVQSGDLNGDGRVDQADLNIIQAALNTPANGPNDARDLNQDGVINALDASILVTLCTNPGCTSQ